MTVATTKAKSRDRMLRSSMRDHLTN